MSSSLPQTAPGVPHEGIDPTLQELGAIKSLEDIGKWLGMEPALFRALTLKIGSSTPKLRDIVFISMADWQQSLQNVRMPADNDEKRPLRPLERGNCEMLKRIARLRLGLPANEPKPADEVPAPPSGGPASIAPSDLAGLVQSAPPDASVKLSAVWDPTLETPLVGMSPQRFRKLSTDYKARRGPSVLKRLS